MHPAARYVVIAHELEKQIFGMSPNSLLPADQHLAKRFQVSRVTIRRGLSLLERKGLISSERGRGTIVNPPKVTRQILPICPIEEDLGNKGLKLETEIRQWQLDVHLPL